MSFNFGTSLIRAMPVDIKLQWDRKAQTDFENKVDDFVLGLIGGAEKWAGDVGASILSLSTDKYLPIDTGVLAKTAYIDKEISKQAITVEVGYNKNETLDYAIIVHEDLNKRHGLVFNIAYAKSIATREILNWFEVIREIGDHRKPQQQAKFLERALYENISFAKERLSKVTITV